MCYSVPDGSVTLMLTVSPALGGLHATSRTPTDRIHSQCGESSEVAKRNSTFAGLPSAVTSVTVAFMSESSTLSPLWNGRERPRASPCMSASKKPPSRCSRRVTSSMRARQPAVVRRAAVSGASRQCLPLAHAVAYVGRVFRCDAFDELDTYVAGDVCEQSGAAAEHHRRDREREFVDEPCT